MKRVAATARAAPVRREEVHTPRVVDAKRFKPQTKDAELKLEFLLKRGAVLVAASEQAVTINHAGRTARIDSLGRVQWDA